MKGELAMKVLAIETSCDETCAAITEGTNILSNVVWSQIDLHAEFGGVVPSIAKRAHEEKIDWVINRSIDNAKLTMDNVNAIAVTAGPGLAIALEVGIHKAKELAVKLNKPLIAVNHIEGHVLSSLVHQIDISFPAMALVVSGGHTELILIEAIGQYKIMARTIDDALGEALDKAARMLGLGYPGGAELEKAARMGNPQAYPLPLPMLGRENQNEFSYSGLKTAFWRLVNQFPVNQLTSQQIADLAACFQDRAFTHLTRVLKKTIYNLEPRTQNLLVGGGVAANSELRKRLSDLDKRINYPTKGLYGDNAAMVGIAAGFKADRGEFVKDINLIDRLPRWRIDQKIDW